MRRLLPPSFACVARSGGIGVVGEDGQATVAFVATLPAVLAAIAVLAQCALLGFTAWGAAGAARAGARAELVGTPSPRIAARAAVPGALARGADVRVRDGVVSVELRAPALIPALGGIPMRASARLDPEGEPG